MTAFEIWTAVRPFLKYIAVVAALVGAYLYIDHKGYQRGFHKRDAEIAQIREKAAEQRAYNEAKARKASDDYATKLASMQPIILRSTNTVREYAQTPAGRAACLGADRVQSILNDRAALFAATAPGSTGSVQPAAAPVADDKRGR